MNEPIFNSVHHLIRAYTTATRPQWLPPGVTNCIVFKFSSSLIDLFYYMFLKQYSRELSCKI